MPQALREAYKWNVYISKDDVRERNKFLKEVIAVNPNYGDVESAENYDNFTIKGVPHWQDGLIIITLPGNILQGFREKNDDNRIYFDKEKRDTIVFMDGGYIIAPVLSGYKYETYEELKASQGINQRIFTNGEFGPFTPVPMVAGDTTPSVKTHVVLTTVANLAPTAISKFDDSVPGEIIFVIGGSNVNPTTIAQNNPNFVGLLTNITFNTGTVAKFQNIGGKFALLGIYQEGSVGAVQFPANESTPSIGNGYLFITNRGCTATQNEIIDFADATVGVPFKVLGGGGINPQIINKAGKFAFITADWTGAEGESIMLQKRSFGDFIEVQE
jgi:hypothetical protein